MNKKITKVIFWADVAVLCAIAFILGALIIGGHPWRQEPKNEPFSEFSYELDRGAVASVKINQGDESIDGEQTDGTRFKTAYPSNFDIAKFLRGKVKNIEVNSQKTNSLLIMIEVLPIILLFPLIGAFVALSILLFIRTAGSLS